MSEIINSETSEGMTETKDSTSRVPKTKPNDLALEAIFHRFQSRAKRQKTLKSRAMIATIIAGITELDPNSRECYDKWNGLDKTEFCSLIAILRYYGHIPSVPAKIIDRFFNAENLYESSEENMKTNLESDETCIRNALANRVGGFEDYGVDDSEKNSTHFGNTKSDNLLCAFCNYHFMEMEWIITLNHFYANLKNEGKDGWFYLPLLFVNDSANRLRFMKNCLGESAYKAFYLWQENGASFNTQNFITTMSELKQKFDCNELDVNVPLAINTLRKYHMSVVRKDEKLRNKNHKFAITKSQATEYVTTRKHKIEIIKSFNDNSYDDKNFILNNLTKFVNRFFSVKNLNIKVTSFTPHGLHPKHEASFIHAVNNDTPYEFASIAKGLIYPALFDYNIDQLIGQTFSTSLKELENMENELFLKKQWELENYREVHQALTAEVLLVSFALQQHGKAMLPKDIANLINKFNSQNMLKLLQDFIQIKGDIFGEYKKEPHIIDQHCRNFERVYPIVIENLPFIIENLLDLYRSLTAQILEKCNQNGKSPALIFARWLYKEDVGLSIFLPLCVQNLINISDEEKIKEGVISYTQRFVDVYTEKFVDTVLEQKDEDEEDVGGSTDENTLENFLTRRFSDNDKLLLSFHKTKSLITSADENGISKEDGINFNLTSISALVMHRHVHILSRNIETANDRGQELKRNFNNQVGKGDYERTRDNRVPLPFFENGMFIILYYNIESKIWEIKEDGEFKQVVVEIAHSVSTVSGVTSKNTISNLEFFETKKSNRTDKEFYRDVVKYFSILKYCCESMANKSSTQEEQHFCYNLSYNLKTMANFIFRNHAEFDYGVLEPCDDANPVWMYEKVSSPKTFVKDCINGKDFS